MTTEQFYLAVTEVKNYSDKDAYINDIALSSVFDTDNERIDEDLMNALSKIWDTVNMPIKQIRATTGLSQAKFCQKYCIPKRTLEDWEAQKRHCPLHEKLLLAAASGLIEFGK